MSTDERVDASEADIPPLLECTLDTLSDNPEWRLRVLRLLDVCDEPMTREEITDRLDAERDRVDDAIEAWSLGGGITNQTRSGLAGDTPLEYQTTDWGSRLVDALEWLCVPDRSDLTTDSE